MRISPRSVLVLLPLSLATAQLIPFFAKSSSSASSSSSDPARIRKPIPVDNQQQQQQPVNMAPQPPQGSSPDDVKIQPSVPLNDILTTHRSLTSFSSLTRLQTSTTSLLSDLGTNTTVLAPLNSAIDALPRKPWESPRDYDTFGAQAYEGDEGQDRANQNLRRFVEAHLVTASPWAEGEKVRTIGGRDVWWVEREGGKRVIMPDEIEVDTVASRVANGEVWILKGVLNYV